MPTTASFERFLLNRLRHELALAEERVVKLKAELREATPTTHPAWPPQLGQVPCWLAEATYHDVKKELLVHELDMGP